MFDLENRHLSNLFSVELMPMLRTRDDSAIDGTKGGAQRKVCVTYIWTIRSFRPCAVGSS